MQVLVIMLVSSADSVVAACGVQVWFAWLVLNMEGVFEDDFQLRRCVENELLSEPSISPEQALKVYIQIDIIYISVELRMIRRFL